MTTVNWKESIRSGPFSRTQLSQLEALLSKLDQAQLQWLRGYFAGLGTIQSVGPATKEAGNVSTVRPSLCVLYGTQTGNAQKLAAVLEKKCNSHGVDVRVQNMALFKPRDFKTIKNLAIIVSTQGLGEPPIEAAELHSILHSNKPPELRHVYFSVLALGDTSYSQFCQTGKDFDLVLEKLGATRLQPRQDCDVDFEEDANSWMERLVRHFHSSNADVVPGADQSDTQTSERVRYSRKNPFQATLMEKINLNGRGSSKETLHIELSLKGSGIQYRPGDSLGIYAENAPSLIENLLSVCRLSGHEQITSNNCTKSIADALRTDFEITPLTSLSLNRYAELTDSIVLRRIISDSQETAKYLHGRDVIDMLKEIPFKMDAVTLSSILRKNTPRMYSLASSLNYHEDEAHVLVSAVRYQSYSRSRQGHCSCFLADRIATDQALHVFVEENIRFRLPSDPAVPIIMIGAGTGVAPYRAFLQQREVETAPGKSWLFFGERNFTTDFLYQVEWQEWVRKGVLTRCNVAFSRDTDRKVYVQHKLVENGKKIFSWLEEGAHVYVCGDAQKMAKDVDQTLKEIVSAHGSRNREKAEEYVKYLQLSDRYQMDVY